MNHKLQTCDKCGGEFAEYLDNGYCQDCNEDVFPKTMAPQEFTHSQGDALRTVKAILEANDDNFKPIVINYFDLVNLAKCFIELENTIKQVRETVRAR